MCGKILRSTLIIVLISLGSAQPLEPKPDRDISRSFTGQAGVHPTSLVNDNDDDDDGVQSQFKRSANPQYYDDYDYVVPSVVVHHTPVIAPPIKVVKTYSSDPAKVVTTYTDYY